MSLMNVSVIKAVYCLHYQTKCREYTDKHVFTYEDTHKRMHTVCVCVVERARVQKSSSVDWLSTGEGVQDVDEMRQT